MMNLLHTLRSRPQLVPRWAIFCLDLCLATVGLGLAYAIRFEFAPPAHELVAARTFLPAYLLIRALSMLVFRTYAGIIRFSGTRDAGRVLLALSAGTGLFFAQDLAAHSMERRPAIPWRGGH